MLLQLVLVLGNANTATTATKLATARKITLTGAVSGSTNFDGSTNISISTAQANIAVLSGTLTVQNHYASATTNYPEGFTSNNCIPISISLQSGNSTPYYFTEYLNKILGSVELNSNSIKISWGNPYTFANVTYKYKVVLMKIS